MTIIKRSEIGRPLTWNELDNNFEEVNSLVQSASAAVTSAAASAEQSAASASTSLDASRGASESAALAQSAITSSLRVPSVETVSPLPPAAVRKSSIMGFDTSGQPLLTPDTEFVKVNDQSQIPASYFPDDVKNSVLEQKLRANEGSTLIGFIQSETGGSAQTLYAHARRTRFAKDYGAIGDGVTDDAIALQNALDASVGGELRMTAGTYLINTMLKISSNTKLTIDGGAVLLRGNASMNGMLINKADGTTGGYLANTGIIVSGHGTIDGNASLLSNPCTLIGFGHATDILIENLTLKNIGGRWHAVEVNAVKKAKISNLTIMNNGAPSDGLGEAIQIDAMQYADKFPWFGPYDNTPCNDILIEHNDISGVGCCIGGHDPSASTNKHTNIRIMENTLSFNVTGIKTQGWSGFKIGYNRLVCANPDTITPVAAILCEYNTAGQSHSDMQIFYNSIFNVIPTNTNQDAGENWRGIYIKGSDTDTTLLNDIGINSNTIKDCLGHAIIVASAQQVNVSSNTIGASRSLAATTNKYSIYQFNGYKVNICGNNCKSPIYLGGGSLVAQTGVCTNNLTEATIIKATNWSKGVIANNYGLTGVPTASTTTALFIGNNVTG